MSARILLVDDDPQVAEAVLPGLQTRGYTFEFITDGRAALNMIASWKPQVVLLDINMKPINGLTICKQIREWSNVPIIMLTIKNKEQDKIEALDLGADDYLTKPFGVGELLARIRVALRHAEHAALSERPVIIAGDLVIDVPKHLVTLSGQSLHLPKKEYDVLRVLAVNAGRVLTHRALLHEVWGQNYDDQDTVLLRRVITELRRKIEPNPELPERIITEPGIGYRFVLPS